MYIFVFILFILFHLSSIHLNHSPISSWKQPILSNEGKVSCTRKQLEPFTGIKFTLKQHPPISQTSYRLCAILHQFICFDKFNI